MLPESNILLSSSDCYLRVSLYFPMLNVTWQSHFIVQFWMLLESHSLFSNAECYLKVTLFFIKCWMYLGVTFYCPVLNVTSELCFIFQCRISPVSHSLLSIADCYLRVTLYYSVLNVTWESCFVVQCWMLPGSHPLFPVLEITCESRFIFQW